jgi:DNA recombination protein RmuC
VRLESHFKAIATEILDENQRRLGNNNETQLNLWLKPLSEQLAGLNKNIADSRTNAATQKAEVEHHLKLLLERTQTLGSEAAALTRALRDCGKVQGDWGEQLLESILQNSGLRKDYEYRTQHSTKATDGKLLRPDVEILCPDGKVIIIDSKTSLTAYTRYIAASTEDERNTAAKENALSIKQHIDELAAKHYERHVAQALDYVLMFIPNEGSYILALQTDKQLADYAFRKGIVLINPTNLMLTLRLIYNLWQSERQNKNIEEVARQSALLYDKFVTYIETFQTVGRNLDNAQQSYTRALRQLHEGPGNIVRRLENLKTLGITPTKQIPNELIEEAENQPRIEQ